MFFPVSDRFHFFSFKTFALAGIFEAYPDAMALIGKDGIISDTTEDKKQRRRLTELKIAAETVSEAKSGFLANTSHEIRTPLNVIIGIAELILRKDIPPQHLRRRREHQTGGRQPAGDYQRYSGYF
jgi:signal transduction histidine kinase